MQTGLLNYRVYWFRFVEHGDPAAPMAGWLRALWYDQDAQVFSALVEADDGTIHDVNATALSTREPAKSASIPSDVQDDSAPAVRS
jgi:hypothetical protein